MAASAAPAWASCSSLGFNAASSQHSAPRVVGVALRSDRDGGFECGCSSSSSSSTDRLHLRAWSRRRRSQEFSLLQVAAGNGLVVPRKEVRAVGDWMGRMGWSVDGEGVGWMAALMGDGRKHLFSRCLELALPVLASAPALVGLAGPAQAGGLGQPNEVFGEVGALLEVGVQLIYLGLLLLFLGVGTFLVVRQVLVRRELETAAKELQDRVRSGEASSEEYYELGAIFLRKKLYSTANKYLEQAIKKWDGDDQDLAQVYNALGFSLYSDDEVDAAIVQYDKAVKLQPGYVKAWNNLGDAYEKKKDYKKALKAYQEALQFDPTNKIALARRDVVKERVKMFQGIPE